ncbi:BamA/TamA family outer membrane protein [Nonlabens tegetincola]|uniref:translocation and assembly module lipoprotein TamL n=1 Tax=Nonlabens tegetincola TaxID=323273 RepID=UPI0030C82585
MTKKRFTLHIAAICTLLLLIVSCNAVKRVPQNKNLLVKNRILVDSLAPDDPRVKTLPALQPNTKLPLIGYPLRLHIYNLARPNKDSLVAAWKNSHSGTDEFLENTLSRKQTNKLYNSLIDFNKWLKRTGESPAIIDKELVTKSEERLKAWYWNQGYFNTEVSHEIIEKSRKKRAEILYKVERNQPYIIDSITSKIESTAIDSLYQITKGKSFVVAGEQYLSQNFTDERDRLNTYFRNHGAYHMEKEYIKFEGDTVNTDHKANITLIIKDREEQLGDSTYTTPFRVHKISKVNIIPDYTNELDSIPADTTRYEDYNIIRYGKRKYRSNTLTDAVFFHEGDIYRDLDRDRTYKRITELQSFLYPQIRYVSDPADSTGRDLIANVLLTSKKKFNVKIAPEATHSNIQTLGIGLNTSLLIRNLFKGSELLDISFRGNIGASSNAATGDSRFFDLQEFGADARLSFPRLFVPFETDGFIPKYMSPSTDFTIGFTSQTNIGLDKQSLQGALRYNWQQTPVKSTIFELVNAQYVRNLDPGNFFNVYRSSYGSLNDIANDLSLSSPTYVNDEGDLIVPDGTSQFIQDGLNGTLSTTAEQQQVIRNIRERRQRLSQNNLIISSSYNWIRNNRQGIYDDDFSRISVRVELAGNVLAGISDLVGVEENSNGQKEVFGVEFSQYVKTEFDYVKHWQYYNGHVLAIRTFAGIAIPYGNSDNIPFIRSFFAGGPNDNRAWQAYELGPGRTGGINDFNEANMKIALNAEYRFPITGAFKGAVFADIGNIWNVLDSEDDPDAIFNDFSDLGALAIGTGVGLRYDFGFFVMRLDAGFKTYNPAADPGERWFKEMKFNRAVLNVGINYPF